MVAIIENYTFYGNMNVNTDERWIKTNRKIYLFPSVFNPGMIMGVTDL